MQDVKFPSQQEALYRTMHNCHFGYRTVCQGIIRAKYWIHLLEDRPASILDVGCGNCKLLNFLRDMRYEDLTGVDIVSGPYEHDSHQFVQVDLEAGKLPFEDQTFDHCFSFDVIEHLSKGYEEIIAEMCRVSNMIIGTIACFDVGTGNSGHGSPLHRTVKDPAEWTKIIDRISPKPMEYLVFESCLQKTLFYHTKKETEHED